MPESNSVCDGSIKGLAGGVSLHRSLQTGTRRTLRPGRASRRAFLQWHCPSILDDHLGLAQMLDELQNLGLRRVKRKPAASSVPGRVAS